MNQQLGMFDNNFITSNNNLMIREDTKFRFVNERTRNRLIAKENVKVSLFRSLFFNMVKFSVILVGKCYSFFSKNIRITLSGISVIGGIFTVAFDLIYLKAKCPNRSLINRNWMIEMLRRFTSIVLSTYIYYSTYDLIESSVREFRLYNKFIKISLMNAMGFVLMFVSCFLIECCFDFIFKFKAKEEIVLRDIYDSQEVYEESLEMFHIKQRVNFEDLNMKMRDYLKIYSDNRVKDNFIRNQNEDLLNKYKLAYEVILKNRSRWN